MVAPPLVPQNPSQVCKLRKSFYGLKQAPWTWFEEFSIVLASLGFCSSDCDFALYRKTTPHRPIILYCNIDDMINVAEMVELKL